MHLLIFYFHFNCVIEEIFKKIESVTVKRYIQNKSLVQLNTYAGRRGIRESSICENCAVKCWDYSSVVFVIVNKIHKIPEIEYFEIVVWNEVCYYLH